MKKPQRNAKKKTHPKQDERGSLKSDLKNKPPPQEVTRTRDGTLEENIEEQAP